MVLSLKIKSGEAGARQTALLIRDLINWGKKEPAIRSLAERILRGLPVGLPIEDIRALFNWVRSHVRYTLDPVDVEYVQTAPAVLRSGVGDCDDICVLLGSLLESVGIPVQLKMVKVGRPDYEHIYLLAVTDRGTVPLETDFSSGLAFGQESKQLTGQQIFSEVSDMDTYSNLKPLVMSGLGAARPNGGYTPPDDLNGNGGQPAVVWLRREMSGEAYGLPAGSRIFVQSGSKASKTPNVPVPREPRPGFEWFWQNVSIGNWGFSWVWVELPLETDQGNRLPQTAGSDPFMLREYNGGSLGLAAGSRIWLQKGSLGVNQPAISAPRAPRSGYTMRWGRFRYLTRGICYGWIEEPIPGAEPPPEPPPEETDQVEVVEVPPPAEVPPVQQAGLLDYQIFGIPAWLLLAAGVLIFMGAKK